MKKGFLIMLIAFSAISVFGQGNRQHEKLKISANGHYLIHDDGTPFFWLGDTGWEIFHRLRLDEIKTYLDNRQKIGFNVIQAVLLPSDLRDTNQYGEVSVLNSNPATPNDKYFQLVDSTLKLVSSRKMYLGLLLTWGDNVINKINGQYVFNTENAYQYGLWLGKRYKGYNNIIWILGGDCYPKNENDDWIPVWREMARGLMDGTGNNAFITYHPKGGCSSSELLHNENWLNMNMVQSSHGEHDMPIWTYIQKDRTLLPAKPVLDAEPNYEDHPVNPWPEWNPQNGYFRDYDVRKQTYRSVFAGACGVTYGHHSVWQFWSPGVEKINYADRYWTDALDRPGAFQVGYLKKLIESRPQLNRIPDQSIILKGQGIKGEYICAFRDSTGSYEMIYIPTGKTITVNTSLINSDKLNVWWFNPRSAESIRIGVIANKAAIDFTTPGSGSENDWVLVIDNAKSNYKILNPKKQANK